MDIIHQLDNLNLNDSDRGEPLDINQESVSASEAVGNVINPDNVIFSAHHVSSKVVGSYRNQTRNFTCLKTAD